MDTFKKLDSVQKCFFLVLAQGLDPQNFTLASEKTQNSQTSESQWKRMQNVPLDIANNRYADCFFSLKKALKN